MREFDLVSIDWDSVELMQAGQFKQETFYQEEMVRWLAQRGRLVGLLHLADDGVSRPTPEGQQTYSVTVHGCLAIGASGHLIELPDEAGLALRGTIEAQKSVIPLYVGVAKQDRLSDPALHPTVDVGLLQCGGRRRAYKLAADNLDPAWEWVQIAQFEKTTEGLLPAANYIPETMFLSSHAVQWRRHKEIRDRAVLALQALQKYPTDNLAVCGIAVGLASSLGLAAVSVDARLHPHAYVERLGGVLVAQHTQLMRLPAPNTPLYQNALDNLAAFVKYIQGVWTAGEALRQARECFELLAQLYPPLLEHLSQAGPEPEKIEGGHKTALSAPKVDTDEQTRPRTMWRLHDG